MTKFIILSAALLITTLTINAQEKAGKKDESRNAVFYTCAMHPDVKSDKAGKCPKCGMDLTLSKKEQMKADITKTYTCPVHVDVASDKPGNCSKCGKTLTLSQKEQMKAEAVKLYSCPMHSDVTSHNPGKCSKCGMDMVEKKVKKTKSKKSGKLT